MEAIIFSLDGKSAGSVKLPMVFSTSYRPDVIKRAVLAEQSMRRQAYGTDVLAGKRTSVHYHGSRHYVFSMMNKELARLPRIHGKSAGYMNLRVRLVAQAVKGRKANPPKAEKIWLQKINQKEMQLAIKSALAASANPELVKKRGHVFHNSPVIVKDDFESLPKTKAVVDALNKIGLEKELERCSRKKVRAGRGKNRGRVYKKKKGPLVILSKECSALKACRGIAGVDAGKADDITAEMLAPGTHAGRLVIITENALKELEKL